jgi:hypothetical protein
VGPDVDRSHWERWHDAYEDPASPLTVRLRLVQDAVRDVLDRAPAGLVRVISMCAGQGRDVTDVVAGHPRASDVRALLVEMDPGLVAFARSRARTAGVGDQVSVVEGDASSAGSYAGAVPADLILICGVLGNIDLDDIATLVSALPTLCAPGATVVWTRHRRPPDRTPAVRELFASAGFTEHSFSAPDPYVLGVGRSTLAVPPGVFDPSRRLFTFVGDGSLPA